MKALRVGDAPGGNYVDKIKAVIESHPELRGRRFIEVDIEHDNLCQIYQGLPCNCDPYVVIRETLT